MSSPEFDHAEPGRCEQDWQRLAAWDRLPPVRLTSAAGRRPDRLVVAVAHPDDETLALAGLVTWAADTGLDCRVVVATDGEASHPASPTHTPDDLRARRQTELDVAVGALHPRATVTRLGLPDGRVADTPDPVEEALVDLVGPDTLVASTWRHDGHADHEAVAGVAAAVAGRAGARHLEAPIWLWHLGTPDDVPWASCARLDLTEDQVERKEQALRAYPSQHEPLSPHPDDAPVLGPSMLEHFRRSFETYVEHDQVPVVGAAGVFERLHRDDPDPWSLAESSYERRKRAHTLAALPEARIGRLLEVGCSVGVLTAELAERADHVVAVDVSPAALAAARHRLDAAGQGKHVRFERCRVPAGWPDGAFDVVVLSEIGYFLTRPQWLDVLERAFSCATDSVLLVHWRHPARGWPLDGPQVHHLGREASAAAGLTAAASLADGDFLLDLFRRRG